MTASAMVITAVLVALSTSVSSALKIAVVGGGIGGGAFSFYMAESPHQNHDITVFETRPRLGGRLYHIELEGGTRVELGGDAWSTAANQYIVALAKQVGLHDLQPQLALNEQNYRSQAHQLWNISSRPPTPTTTITREGGLSDPISAGVAIWTGARMVNLSSVLRGHTLEDLRAVVAEAGFLGRLRENYLLRGSSRSFETIEEFLEGGNLGRYTEHTARKFYQELGLVGPLVDLFVEPMSRVIYDQCLDESHAFSSLVALTSMLGADSFGPGNDVLVKRLFASANATVHLSTTVRAITVENKIAGNDDDGPRIGTSQAKKYRIEALGPDGQPLKAGNFDAVVIATPFEFSNISLPPGAIRPASRPFRHIYVTLVRAKGPSQTYFSSWGESGSGGAIGNWCTNILTTQNSSSPFTVLQMVTDRYDDGTAYWKLFSNDDVRSLLPHILDGLSEDPNATIVQHWPYTFPVLSPKVRPTNISSSSYQPISLGGGVFYVNGMESVASAMEGSIIAARNIALLLQKIG